MARVIITAPSPPDQPKPWAPHNYQRKGIKFLVEHAAAALLLDPGLGKTSITLGAKKVLDRKLGRQKMLVIAPRRPMRLVWPKEVEKWADFGHMRVAVLHGDHKEDALAIDADIYAINPEGLPWLLANNGKRLKQLIRVGVTILAVDESTKFKNTQSKRFKLLKPFLPLFQRRWILTGTPAPNGLLDIFGQMYICDLGKALGQFITHYRNQFFSPSGFLGYNWKIQEGAEKKIYARLRPLSLRMDAEDYLELPEVVPNPIYVELPPEARRVYDELEEEMITDLVSGHTVTAATAATASMKCSQVANGAIYLDTIPGVKPKPGERWQNIHDAKIEALQDLLEDLQGKPALIAYDFNHDLERLRAVLGKDVPVIGGGTSDRKAEAIERAWNAGEMAYLLGHPASMGHGLNFQYGGCADVIWFGIPWDLELFDQFIKRVRRQGNLAKRVRVHLIIAKDTVDELKVASLGAKDMTQKALLEALKTRRRKSVTGESLSFTASTGSAKSDLMKGGQPRVEEEAVGKTLEQFEAEILANATHYMVKTHMGSGQAKRQMRDTLSEAVQLALTEEGPGGRSACIYAIVGDKGVLVEQKHWGVTSMAKQGHQSVKENTMTTENKTTENKTTKTTKTTKAKTTAAKGKGAKPEAAATEPVGTTAAKVGVAASGTKVSTGKGTKATAAQVEKAAGKLEKATAKVTGKGGKGKGAATPAADKAASKAPAADKVKESSGGRGRTSPFVGRTIEKLVKSSKDTNLREGSLRAAMLDAVLKVKTFDEALGLTVEHGGETHTIGSSNLHGMVDRGHIAIK